MFTDAIKINVIAIPLPIVIALSNFLFVLIVRNVPMAKIITNGIISNNPSYLIRENKAATPNDAKIAFSFLLKNKNKAVVPVISSKDSISIKLKVKFSIWIKINPF